MPRTHSFTPQTLLALGQQVRNAPPVEYDPWKGERPLTRLEMVGMLKDDIATMRDKGYSVVQIAEFLSTNGFKISANGLYDTMRKLDCSLTRKPVPLAQLILRHLATPNADHAPNATRHGPDVDSSAKARRVPRRGNGNPASLPVPVDQGPERIAILPQAQRLLRKLKPSEAIVFKEALSQLRQGQQFINLDAQTVDAGQRLTAVGLLRPLEEQGNYVYEVPYEMAHVENLKRHPETFSGT